MVAEKQSKTDLGRIKIHTHAVSSIAAIAAMEVDGVLKIQPGLIGKLYGFFGGNPNFIGVRVVLKENNEVDISTSIVVAYGQDVPKVANFVQENVRQAIEKMTSLIPANIDVKVKGIEKVLRRKDLSEKLGGE